MNGSQADETEKLRREALIGVGDSLRDRYGDVLKEDIPNRLTDLFAAERRKNRLSGSTPYRCDAILRGAEITQARMRFAAEALHERGGEPRFPGLTGDEHHLAFTGLCPGPTALPQFLFLPTNQSPRLCPSGLHARGPLARTEKPPGALTDDDRIRRGDALQTCCED